LRIPLDIPPGVYPDETSLAASGRWRDASNVRFHRRRPQLIGGWESFSGELLTGVCRNLLPWTDNAGELVVAFGTHSALQLMRGGSLYTITPVGLAPGSVDGLGGRGYGAGAYGSGTYGSPSAGDIFPRTWALANWGESLMANPRGGTIYWWRNDTAVAAAPLTGAPAAVSHMLVTNTRQVMALGCNEALSGGFNPLAIRFTDVENPTSWTITAANLAEELVLEGGGRIVAGRLVGDLVFVWTDVGLYQGRFLGDPSQPWRFDLLGRNCGLVGPNAAVVKGQTAFWRSPDGSYFVCVPDSAPQALPCPLQVEVTDNLAPAQQEKITASTVSAFDEVRWDYPDTRDGAPGLENSRYVAVSTADPETPWCKGVMARSAFADAGPTPSPIGVTPQGQVYYHERGVSADGGPIAWSLNGAAQMAGEGDRLIRINRFWPDFEGQQGAVQLRLGLADAPQAPVRWKGPWSLSPGQRKRDLRAIGRLVEVQLSGASSPAAWRMGRPLFEIQTEGAR
jgi:hypothetical protein